MTQEHAGARAFLYWVVSHLVGWLLIVALLVLLPVLKSIGGPAAPILIIALPLSLTQWLVLRRVIPLTPLWVLTIPAGWPAGWLLFYLVTAALPPAWVQGIDDEAISTLTLFFALIGAAMGLPQWLILRRHFTGATLWILGSSVGVGLGLGLVLATGLISRSENVSYTVVVLLYGLVTGLILWRWLDRHTLARLQRSEVA
jgi:hypothetical protein